MATTAASATAGASASNTFGREMIASILDSQRFDTYDSSILCAGDNSFVYALAKLANVTADETSENESLRFTMPVRFDDPADANLRVFAPRSSSIPDTTADVNDDELAEIARASKASRIGLKLPRALDDNTFYVLSSFAYFTGRAKHYREKLVELKNAYEERRRIEDEYARLLKRFESLRAQQFRISHAGE